VDGTNHILFALIDLNLQQDSSNDSRELMLDAQDLRISLRWDAFQTHQHRKG